MDTSTTTTRGRGGPPIDRTTCTARFHGTSSSYRYGCRCDDARNAYRIRKKRIREGRHAPAVVDATGTVRRLRALAAIGWSLNDLATPLGMTRRHVTELRSNAGGGHTHRATADKITALYNKLSATPGPSPKVRTWAKKHGWVPPLAWEYVDVDDPNAQPEVEAPPEPGRRSAVLVENYDYLVSAGLSPELAAKQLGIEPESIGNARKRVKVSQARRAQVARKQEAAA